MNIEFWKGHGTQNDFVIIPDPAGQLELSAADVQFLCNRRAGIGGDGLLRVVPARQIQGYEDCPLWFMDYRNADGSIAEMCGNGLRVFAKYLVVSGLVSETKFQVMTRAGQRSAEILADGRIKISMGKVRTGAPTWVQYQDRKLTATPVNVGNPHAVVKLPEDLDLAGLDLSQAPQFDHSVFPNGTNIEFITGKEPIQMRVFERGVGETMSCGTGVVATAAVGAPDQSGIAVQVRGGDLTVDFEADQAFLTGPAELVAKGDVALVEEKIDG